MPSNLEQSIMRFPLGVDQVSPETALPPGAARSIVNLDVQDGAIGQEGPDGGRLKTRSRVKLAVAGTNTHSLWSCEAATLYVANGDLMMLDANMGATVLRASVGHNEMFYTEVNGVVYYSNDVVTGKVIDGIDSAWGLPVPAGPNASAFSVGGMTAGTYMVAYTYLDADGRESGASPTSLVQVAEGGGIALADIETNGYRLRIYVTGPNGDVLYWCSNVADGSTSAYVGTHQPGKALATMHMQPPYACTLLNEYSGRIYGVVGNDLVCTQPMNFDLTLPTEDFIMFSMPPTMNQSVVDGMYIGTMNGVEFFAGTKLGEFSKHRADSLPPIPGSAMKVDGKLFGAEGEGVIWLTRRGWVFGGASGQVKRLTESRMALPDYDRATSLYREHDGMRQVMSFVQGGGESARASDSYEIEIVRNGRIV